MAYGDARDGKWRGNWWMVWVASTLHTTSEHGVSSITTADAHTSTESSRLNWRPRRFKWILSVSPKDEIWFPLVCHHISNAVYHNTSVRARRDGTRWRTGGEVKGELVNGVVASTLHTTSEHGVSSITTADAHTSADSSPLNWRPRWFKWILSVSPKDEIWFPLVCHHISNAVYHNTSVRARRVLPSLAFS
jgi:hypothetical protein